MLRVFNNTARFVTQGAGKRNGSFAMYLEPWHADIFEFLNMRKNHGAEEHRSVCIIIFLIRIVAVPFLLLFYALYLHDNYDFVFRARDLFYGLWVPDLFMKRVEQDGTYVHFLRVNFSIGLFH